MKAIILSTCCKHEKYVDGCLTALGGLWPGHPKVWVISNKGNFQYKGKVIINNLSWVKVMAEGINTLIRNKEIKKDDYVLFLLEDHTPLSLVPANLIGLLSQYAEKERINFLSLTGHGGGRKVAEVRGRELFEIYNSFRFYSEYHPAIWKVSHFVNIMEKSLEANCVTAWDSEHIRDVQVKHYTVGRDRSGRFIWPSSFGGFLIQGSVNISAVKKMKHPALRPLKKMLIRECVFQAPRRLIRKIKNFNLG